MKKLFFTIVLLLCTLGSSAWAQEVTLGVRGGANTTFGGVGAVSLEGSYDFANRVALRGGVLWSTIGRTAVELRPTYSHELDWGTVSAKAIAHYTQQASIYNLAIGAGVGWSNTALFCSLGYYYRTIGGGGGRIDEPFNLFYEIGVRFLREVEGWDLQVALTNSDMFELERHYYPSLVALCNWSVGESTEVIFGLNYKPSGTFHMSTDLYQIQFRTGVCYRW